MFCSRCHLSAPCSHKRFSMCLDWIHLNHHLVSGSLTLIASAGPLASMKGSIVTGSEEQDIDNLESHCSAHFRSHLSVNGLRSVVLSVISGGFRSGGSQLTLRLQWSYICWALTKSPAHPHPTQSHSVGINWPFQRKLKARWNKMSLSQGLAVCKWRACIRDWGVCFWRPRLPHSS